jgi:hypothetical protein
MAARPSYLLVTVSLFASACATSRQAEERGPGGKPAIEAEPGLVAPQLASSHCKDGTCVCRGPGDKREDPLPVPGKKRIEIRMSNNGRGTLTLDSSTAGHFEHKGEEETCYYVDLDVSTLYSFHVASKEEREGGGVKPRVHVSEYGPHGHYWYDILDVACGVGDRGCDPDLAREWGQSWLEKRKRGRLDACGSLVVVGLRWNTSGGQAEANGWLLRDFDADFGLEVKKFATEFPPGSPECTIGH